MNNIELRVIDKSDSLKELTVLLNRSYKILLDMGLTYVAATQDEAVTARRVKRAYKCFIGVLNREIVSTASLYKPSNSEESNWYNQKHVAKFGQFAVKPELQCAGIGAKMMDLIEYEASSIEEVTELALDTAETAHHLIRYYERRGYRIVETIQWASANYRSVVMSKTLSL